MFWKLARRSVLIACVLMLLGRVFAPAQGCGCGPGPEDFLPTAAEVGQGFAIITTATFDRAELASTFTDSVGVDIRFDALWWAGQATRTYERGSFDVEVSAHMFVLDAEAILAMPWFAKQRAALLGLNWDGPPRFLGAAPDVSYQAVSGVRADGHNEYTLYAQRDQVIIRMSVTSSKEDIGALAQLADSITQNAI